MNALTRLPWDAVSRHDHKIITTSLKVAEVFGKRHDHILRDIEGLGQSRSGLSSGIGDPKSGEPAAPNLGALNQFCRLNFEADTYRDAQKKPRPMYEMTKDGFTLLVMGYTGDKAMAFKVAYINEFNAMAAHIAQGKDKIRSALERDYFRRFPKDQTIRLLAQNGEPYWYIGQIVQRSAATVGKAIKRMIDLCLIDAELFAIQRTGRREWFALRRKHFHQLRLF